MHSSDLITVNLEAIISYSSWNQFGELVEIASVNDGSEPNHDGWENPVGEAGEVMGHGWTRYNFGDVGKTIELSFYTSSYMDRFWHSQANHVFSRLQITSNFEDYMYVENVNFEVEIGPLDVTKKPPEGFLFLCPPADFQTDTSSLRWPDCAAYWSLDPLGAGCLSMEDATQLGFPSIELMTEVHGHCWDENVYTGLRQFHQAKGFDPDSQEVALRLGEPLYQFSNEMDVPFAYVDDEDTSG